MRLSTLNGHMTSFEIPEAAVDASSQETQQQEKGITADRRENSI